MIPTRAIEKAIEGEWAPPTSFAYKDLVDGVVTIIVKDPNAIALDPSFWQALGKALGWAEHHWLPFAEDFLNLILTGDNTDQFWAELLTQPNGK